LGHQKEPDSSESGFSVLLLFDLGENFPLMHWEMSTANGVNLGREL